MRPGASRHHLSLAFLLLWPLAGCVTHETPVPEQPPSFTLREAAGVEHRPFEEASVKAVALFFVLPDCPIANGYAPEIQRIAAEYGPRGVKSFLVHVDPDLTPAKATEHAREFGYTCPVVLDRDHALSRSFGVERVPEVVVLTPDGNRRYRGRIDDLYLAIGKRQSQATTHDLRMALDAVLDNKPVQRPETHAVGCYLPLVPSPR